MLTATEEARIEALKEYDILDTLPEKNYDSIATIASQICQTPVAHISFIDGTRQWFKSKVGFGIPEVPKDIAFCTYLVNNPSLEVLLVNDAKEDERFYNNPLTHIETPIIFCASVPLKNSSKQVLGSLCVIDHKPRKITAAQIDSLHFLAASIFEMMEKKKIAAALIKRERQLSDAQEIARLASFEWDIASNNIQWSASVYSVLNLPLSLPVHDVATVLQYIHPDDKQMTEEMMNRLPSTAEDEQAQCKLVTPAGEIKFLNIKRRLSCSASGNPELIIGTIQDITEQKLFERKMFDAIVESEEKERSRIAAELHDGVCQHLAAAHLTIQSAISILDAETFLARKLFIQGKEILKEALELTRRVSHQLAPSKMQEQGLFEALQTLIENLNGIDKIKYHLHKKGKNKSLDETISVNLLRIVQEFIRNSQKHSEANEVIITMHYKKKILELSVCDDGRGFDSGQIKNEGIGIFNMVKRIETIGGSYTYFSAPKKGVNLNIQIPTS